MVSVKVEASCKKGVDVRRIRIEDLPKENKSDFQTVTSYVQTAFPNIPHFVLKYKDDEGDLVTVASETEFQEAIRLAALAKRCLKLHLVAVSAPKPQKELPVPVVVDPQISDPLRVQFQYLSQTRDLVVSKSKVGIPTLREGALNMFPELKSKDFSLKYYDDEGDAVTMTEADELQDALQLVKDAFIIVVSLNIGNVPTNVVSGSSENERSKPQKGKKEEERKKKKQWEDVTWDDLNETLEKLQKLGFTDTALCTRLLEQHNYDFEAVLSELKRGQNEKGQ